MGKIKSGFLELCSKTNQTKSFIEDSLSSNKIQQTMNRSSENTNKKCQSKNQEVRYFSTFLVWSPKNINVAKVFSLYP